LIATDEMRCGDGWPAPGAGGNARAFLARIVVPVHEKFYEAEPPG
jgi:hypothetical protein